MGCKGSRVRIPPSRPLNQWVSSHKLLAHLTVRGSRPRVRSGIASGWPGLRTRPGAGAIAKGEGTAPVAAAKSTKARADVKVEAATANKSGATPSTKREEAGNRPAKVTMTKEEKAEARAKRKAEAAAANKAGAIPKGEVSK